MVKKQERVVNVQMKLDATEALRILRRRYKVKGMSVALMMFIKEHDLELYEASQKRAAEFEELTGDGGDDDSA